MKRTVDGSTDRRLLREVADWNNHEAWVIFRETYDPLLRRWCRPYRLGDDAIDEVCHLIWIELADRMKTFEYDPTRTFRGWLRRLCECRVLNFLRQQRAASVLNLGEWIEELASIASPVRMDVDETDEYDHLRLRFLLDEGEKVQAAVKARIKPSTWDAFWLVAVCDWSVDRTARSLGISHVAVYAARDRVALMLADEGKRASAGWAADS